MDGSRIVSFTVEGHTGLAEAGEDILCAAVPSAVRLTECAVNDVLGMEDLVKVNQQDASPAMINCDLLGIIIRRGAKHVVQHRKICRKAL